MPEEAGGHHIVLVGMMGSGKTTVGRRIARKLDVPFVDTDTELVASSGRKVAEWFSDVGEEGFRAAEAQVMVDTLGTPGTSVVATGGGAVLAESSRELLKDGAHTVIWLRAGPAFLSSRITRKAEQKKRPLLGEDPRAALERLDEERRDLYAEVADIVVDIEPVMTDAEHPRKKLAAVVVETLARTGVRVS